MEEEKKKKKIRYIDEEEMHLITGTGKPEVIKKGTVKEYPETFANMLLRSKRRIFKEHRDKKGELVKITWEDIPRWEEVKGGK
ncbi:MAG TPA: hypothetical protein ENI52_03965 [Thermoplasmata archaeon]|nr:hypothetical protein [Thermoplasmata archaeon]